MKDLEVLSIIRNENDRQKHTLRMIASENEPSNDVRYALSSVKIKFQTLFKPQYLY